MKESEKPFRIEWWIDLMFKSIQKQEKAIDGFNNHTGNNDDLAHSFWNEKLRYSRLAQWIYNRIIQKYGEQ